MELKDLVSLAVNTTPYMNTKLITKCNASHQSEDIYLSINFLKSANLGQTTTIEKFSPETLELLKNLDPTWKTSLKIFNNWPKSRDI